MAKGLTTADRVARKAVYGYSTDVISAALYANVILPNRWRALIREARAQQLLERHSWENLADVRYRLSRNTAAQAIQRVFRNRQTHTVMVARLESQEVVYRCVRRWVAKHRELRDAASRREAVADWLQRAVGVCVAREDAAKRIQCSWRRYRPQRELCVVRDRSVLLIQHQWRAHHIRKLQLMEFDRRLMELRVRSSREKIRCWMRVILFRRIHAREQHQMEREIQGENARNQAACWIQTRWRLHHQRVLRCHLMTEETVPSDVEETSRRAPTTESDSDPCHEVLQRRMQRRLEQFLLVCINKTRRNHAKHQSRAAGRVINRCIRRYLQRQRQWDYPSHGPEVDEPAGGHATVEGRPEDGETMEDSRVIGLSGRIPIRPPRLSERSSASGILSHHRESTSTRTAIASVPCHSQLRSSSRLHESTRSKRKASGVTTSSLIGSTVTTPSTILPPLQIPRHLAKPHAASQLHRLVRIKSDISGNQAAHQSFGDIETRIVRQMNADGPGSSNWGAIAMRALPPLQRMGSVAGAGRLLKRFDPQRERLPRIRPVTNQVGET